MRYADDTLLGFAGPKAEAEEIKQRVAQFLHAELKLEPSPENTLVTHARTQAARFLGYDITVHHNDRKVTGGRRSVNGVIRLRVPCSVVSAKQAQYMKRGKPSRRPELLNQDDHVILSTYGAEYRGIVQYYLLAGDVFRLARLQWVMETSMLRTLANKHRSSVSKMARKYAATIETPHGRRKCFEARVERIGRKPLVGRFGGSRCDGTRRRSSPTVGWPRSTPDARSWSPGYSQDGARHAGESTRWKSTTSPSSPTSDDRAIGRHGQISWPHGTTSPSIAAGVAMRPSTARDLSQRSLSPFLVAASSGLGEEALAGEATEAAAGDVDGRLVGGHAEEFVQLANSEYLVGVLVERVHDVLVGGVHLGWIGFGSCWCDLRDDLSSGGQIRESRFALGQCSGEVLDLAA
nr:group II intron reverse transcriptase/maturase [Streptomyces chryseus]